jgi:hypothetical protein
MQEDLNRIETDTVGLCAGCAFVRLITSSRGTVFYLCERSRTNPAFPKYPPLPVLRCTGHVPRDAAAGRERGEGVTD